MSRSRRVRGRGSFEAPSPSLQLTATPIEGAGERFVSIVAEEMALGIDCALCYWLGRIEHQLGDRTQTVAERISSVEQILRELKDGRTGLANS